MVSAHEKVTQQFVAQLHRWASEKSWSSSSSSSSSSPLSVLSFTSSAERNVEGRNPFEGRGRRKYRRPASPNIPLSRFLCEEKKKKKKERMRSAASETSPANTYWLGAAAAASRASTRLLSTPNPAQSSSTTSSSTAWVKSSRPKSSHRILSLHQWRLFLKRRSSLRRRSRPAACRRHLRRAIQLRQGRRSAGIESGGGRRMRKPSSCPSIGCKKEEGAPKDEGHGKESARDGNIATSSTRKIKKRVEKEGKGWCWLPSHHLCCKRLAYRRLRRVVVLPTSMREEQEGGIHSTSLVQKKDPLSPSEVRMTGASSSSACPAAAAGMIIPETNPTTTVSAVIAAPVQRLGKHHRVLQRWVQRLTFTRSVLAPRRILSESKRRDGPGTRERSYEREWQGISTTSSSTETQCDSDKTTFDGFSSPSPPPAAPPLSRTHAYRSRASSTAVVPPTSFLMDLTSYCVYAITCPPLSSLPLGASTKKREEVGEEEDMASPTHHMSAPMRYLADLLGFQPHLFPSSSLSVFQTAVTTLSPQGESPLLSSTAASTSTTSPTTSTNPVASSESGGGGSSAPSYCRNTTGGLLHGYMKRYDGVKENNNRKHETKGVAAGDHFPSPSPFFYSSSSPLPQWVPSVLLWAPLSVGTVSSPTHVPLPTTAPVTTPTTSEKRSRDFHREGREGLGCPPRKKKEVREEEDLVVSSSSSFFLLIIAPDPVLFPSAALLAKRGMSVTLISLWTSSSPLVSNVPNCTTQGKGGGRQIMLLGSLLEWWWQPTGRIRENELQEEEEREDVTNNTVKRLPCPAEANKMRSRKRERQEGNNGDGEKGGERRRSCGSPETGLGVWGTPTLGTHISNRSRLESVEALQGKEGGMESWINKKKSKNNKRTEKMAGNEEEKGEEGNRNPLCSHTRTVTPLFVSTPSITFPHISPRSDASFSSSLSTVTSLLQEVLRQALQKDTLGRDHKRKRVFTSSSTTGGGAAPPSVGQRMMIVFPSLLPPFSLKLEENAQRERKGTSLFSPSLSPPDFVHQILLLHLYPVGEEYSSSHGNCESDQQRDEGHRNDSGNDGAGGHNRSSSLDTPSLKSSFFFSYSRGKKEIEKEKKEKEKVFHWHFSESRRFFSKLLSLGKSRSPITAVVGNDGDGRVSSTSSLFTSPFPLPLSCGDYFSRMTATGGRGVVWSIGEEDRATLLQALGRPLYPQDYGYEDRCHRNRAGRSHSQQNPLRKNGEDKEEVGIDEHNTCRCRSGTRRRRKRKGSSSRTSTNGRMGSTGLSSSLPFVSSSPHWTRTLAAFGSPFNAHRRILIRPLRPSSLGVGGRVGVDAGGGDCVDDHLLTHRAPSSLYSGAGSHRSPLLPPYPPPHYYPSCSGKGAVAGGRLPAHHSAPGCRLLRLRWEEYCPFPPRTTPSGLPSPPPPLPPRRRIGILEMCGVITSPRYFMRRLGSMVAAVWLCIPPTTPLPLLPATTTSSSSFSTNSLWIICHASTAQQLVHLHRLPEKMWEKGGGHIAPCPPPPPLEGGRGDGRGVKSPSTTTTTTSSCEDEQEEKSDARHQKKGNGKSPADSDSRIGWRRTIRLTETEQGGWDDHTQKACEERELWDILYNPDLCTWVEPVELFG